MKKIIFRSPRSLDEVPEHGDYDPLTFKWYCNKWLSQQEWEDIHDYLLSDDSNNSSDKFIKGQSYGMLNKQLHKKVEENYSKIEIHD